VVLLPARRKTNATSTPGHYFGGCVRCTVHALSVGNFACAPSVFLVSDDPISATSLDALVPPDTVSSPLLGPNATTPINIDRASRLRDAVQWSDAQKRDSMLTAFAEIFALSGVDVLVHSKSGFSKIAAEWAVMPTENVRMLPRNVRQVSEPQQSCGTGVYFPSYYMVRW
jgi:hypothetical protein